MTDRNSDNRDMGHNSGTVINGGNFHAKAQNFGPDSSITITEASDPIKKIATKVLLAFANPVDYKGLGMGDEERTIREAWRLGSKRDVIEIKSLHAVTTNDLRRALQDGPDIVHLAGHGTPDGVILTDEKGMSQLVTLKAMEAIFQERNKKTRCVVLNQCYSLPLGKILTRYVPYAIAIEGKLDDVTALEFSRGFYDAISEGEDIVTAYKEGCRSIKSNYSNSVFLPQLLP